MKSAVKTRNRIQEESIEAKRGDLNQVDELKKMPLDAMKTFWDQLLKPSTKDASEQLFGLEHKNGKKGRPLESGLIDLEEGEDHFIFGGKNTDSEEAKEISYSSEHREYFREIKSTEVAPMRRQEKEDSDKCAQIMVELRRISKQSKILENEVKTILVQPLPPKAGKYHASFMEWLLITLKNASKRIDEGVAWARTFSSKKKQKQYWNMSKKHGTTFMLSGERSVSTQTA